MPRRSFFWRSTVHTDTVAGAAPQVERPTWGPAATVVEATQAHDSARKRKRETVLRTACKVRRERLELHGDLVKAVRKGDLFAVASLVQRLGINVASLSIVLASTSPVIYS